MPLRVNMAGVIPVIFAAALLALPADDRLVRRRARRTSSTRTSRRGSWTYLVVEAVLIIVFTFFYTAVQFNPVDQADNLRKYGGYIPGIRPGPPTAQYLDRVLTRLTLPGSLFLATVAVLPSVFINYVQLLAGDLARPRRHLGADRRRRRARHDAPDGVADDDALLRRLLALNLLVLGPAGRRKGDAGQADRSRLRDPAHLDGRHVPRRDRGAEASSGKQVEPILAAGELVPDEITIALIRERLGRARRRRRLRARRLPAQPRAGGRARRDARARSAAASTRSSSSTSPTTSRPSGCSARAGEESRPDDTPEVIAERLAHLPRARRSRSSSTTGVTGKLVPLHAERTIDEVYAEVQEALEPAGATPHDHPQVARARSSGWPRPAPSSPRRSPSLEERLEPGISMVELDRIAEDYIRSQRRGPDLEGLQGLSRRRSASRRTR